MPWRSRRTRRAQLRLGRPVSATGSGSERGRGNTGLRVAIVIGIVVVALVGLVVVLWWS
ncbi:MAG: hypothetical protein ACRDG7_08280 [Candidatus Limnocylindria bacterium]